MNNIPLQIRQLSVNYGKTPALWDVSLTIPPAKRVAIVGPNGAGKSTLLKASLGLIKPISGSVQFFGAPLQAKKGVVAYIPQKESLDWDFPMTVFDLVMMGCYGRIGLFRYPKKEDKDKVWHFLKSLGLEGVAGKQISQLSGGQQQKAFMARALAQEADLYLMDEPFSGIDVAAQEKILEFLNLLKDQGKTVLVVHHNLQNVTSLFDWVVLLNMSLVGAGDVKEVFTPEMIKKAFGQDRLLFEQAMQRNEEKQRGYPS